jgi:manganese/zinc/iron transport system permease protein
VSPYWGKNFWTFWQVVLKRVALALQGEISSMNFAADELQLIVLSLVGTSCAVLGCFLLLRKMAMLANALSHTILLGIVLAYMLLQTVYAVNVISLDSQVFIVAALLSAFLTTGLTRLCSQKFCVQEDASIGLIFTFLFSLGIILVTLFTKNVHIGAEIVMGNADALHVDDVKRALWLICVNLLSIGILFSGWKITSFDPVWANVIGLHTSWYHYFLMFLTAATCIHAFRVVGIVLVLSFLVGPYLIARLISHRLGVILGLSIMISIGTVAMGVALSRHMLSVYMAPISTSALIGVLFFFEYILLSLIQDLWKKIFCQKRAIFSG